MVDIAAVRVGPDQHLCECVGAWVRVWLRAWLRAWVRALRASVLPWRAAMHAGDQPAALEASTVRAYTHVYAHVYAHVYTHFCARMHTHGGLAAGAIALRQR